MSHRRLPLTVYLALLGSFTVIATAQTTPPSRTIQAEVQAASTAWIAAFNRGDYQACASGYTEDASMQGRPLADIQGRDAIAEFWKGVLAQKPGDLVYEDTQIHVLGDKIAILSARWSMSRLGRGIITLERWEKQTDGAWRLAEDIFEILEQFPAATE